MSFKIVNKRGYTPLECLAEDTKNLANMVCDENYPLPFWLTKKEAIKETVEAIIDCVNHISEHGNNWTDEHEV